MKVFLLIETNPHGIFPYAFKHESSRNDRLKQILKEYSDFYGREFSTLQELHENTDDIWIDFDEVPLED